DIMEGIVGKIDMIAEARMHLERVRMSIANTMSNPLINDPRIHHVRYRDFVGDPVGTIRGYYEFAGRELTPQAEAAMRGYLANNKGDRHGKFEYSTKLLTEAGYDIDELNEEFRPFRERFNVEIEKRD
ncbi:MAG: sulfotransferase, partial [Novosphingobium sp.]|nr:sulfotransferase [Novosphingobium sp.]